MTTGRSLIRIYGEIYIFMMALGRNDVKIFSKRRDVLQYVLIRIYRMEDYS